MNTTYAVRSSHEAAAGVDPGRSRPHTGQDETERNDHGRATGLARGR
jgi:hypothetical protein